MSIYDYTALDGHQLNNLLAVYALESDLMNVEKFKTTVTSLKQKKTF